MWVLVLTLLTVTGQSVRAMPPLDLELISELLDELEELPLEERTDGTISPELMELYHDVELLFEMQKGNLSESREGRGFLSKLSFLTGLKLGSFLTSSGTLAASQSINFLGKILNAALSISYGNIGGYPGQSGFVGGEQVVSEQIGGLQTLPVIQEDVPLEDKKRERPDSLATSPASTTNTKTGTTPELIRKEFINQHNQRVDNFNDNFEKKIKTRTGRIDEIKSDQIT